MQRDWVVAPEPPQGWRHLIGGVMDRLYAHFGPQHWWPAVGVPEPQPAPAFEMIVGAILVQNIAWANTERALVALRDAGLLEPQALHLAPAEMIEPLIRPTGYFRQKARKLKGFAEHLSEIYGGDLQAMLSRPVAELRAELLSLGGIGPETCDCILCYAAGYPVMPMDAYTRRIFVRLGVFEQEVPYEAMQLFFHANLGGADPGEYHAQIDTLGHRICLKAKPLCSRCPLQEICQRRGVEVQA